MADVVDKATRSRMMSGIRGRDTRPELVLRRGLHAAGFRYRLHVAGLPGRPDLVFPGRHAVIFVNGCFWHGHDCHLFKWPCSRPEFWRDKIAANCRRDRENVAALGAADWRVLVIWECALKGRTRLEPGEVIDRAAAWLRGTETRSEIAGKDRGGC